MEEYAATTYHRDLLEIINRLPQLVAAGIGHSELDDLVDLLANLKDDQEASRTFEVTFDGRPQHLRVGFYSYGKDAFGQESAEINIAAERPLLTAIEQYIESVILRGD